MNPSSRGWAPPASAPSCYTHTGIGLGLAGRGRMLLVRRRCSPPTPDQPRAPSRSSWLPDVDMTVGYGLDGLELEAFGRHVTGGRRRLSVRLRRHPGVLRR